MEEVLAARPAKAEMLPRITHELRTPLNAILGYAQLIDGQPELPPSLRAWNDQILMAGRHLLAIVDDVLDLSCLGIDELRLDLQAVRLAPLLAECVAMVQVEAARGGVCIEADPAASDFAVSADPTRLRQVLLNLLTNAVKYNRRGGSVHLRLVATGDEVTIEVSDTGLGMSARQLERLFQPFDRLGRERCDQPGTGLGLTVSKQLAEAMGGCLEAHSVEGEGSRFTLTMRRCA